MVDPYPGTALRAWADKSIFRRFLILFIPNSATKDKKYWIETNQIHCHFCRYDRPSNRCRRLGWKFANKKNNCVDFKHYAIDDCGC